MALIIGILGGILGAFGAVVAACAGGSWHVVGLCYLVVPYGFILLVLAIMIARRFILPTIVRLMWQFGAVISTGLTRSEAGDGDEHSDRLLTQ